MLSILFICFNHYHNSETLGFFYFVGLKIHQKPLVYADQCWVPGWTLQNKSGLSKVTPLTKGTWLCTKNCPRQHLWKIFSLSLSSSFLNFFEPPTLLSFSPFYNPPPPPTVLPFNWILGRYLSHHQSSLPFLDHEGRFWGCPPYSGQSTNI